MTFPEGEWAGRGQGNFLVKMLGQSSSSADESHSTGWKLQTIYLFSS